jgi:hypothetical protein
MEWAGHVACIGAKRNAYMALVGKSSFWLHLAKGIAYEAPHYSVFSSLLVLDTFWVQCSPQHSSQALSSKIIYLMQYVSGAD